HRGVAHIVRHPAVTGVCVVLHGRVVEVALDVGGRERARRLRMVIGGGVRLGKGGRRAVVMVFVHNRSPLEGVSRRTPPGCQGHYTPTGYIGQFLRFCAYQENSLAAYPSGIYWFHDSTHRATIGGGPMTPTADFFTASR